MGKPGSHYISRNLMPGERLILAARIDPLMILPPAMLAVSGLVSGIIGLATDVGALTAVGFICCVCASVVTLSRWIEFLTTEYSCTDRRILIKSGWLTTTIREMPLTKVEALVFAQSLIGKLLGYGTLVFKGSGGTRRRCECIEEPEEFYRCVQEQVAIAQGTAEP